MREHAGQQSNQPAAPHPIPAADGPVIGYRQIGIACFSTTVDEHYRRSSKWHPHFAAG
jgi:hypothetical protein